MVHSDPRLPHPSTDSGEIIVYWRPGCPFCSSLRSGLRCSGVAFREVNIWEHPAAAAFVRSVARGNESVPTVSVGSVNLVNPSTKAVLNVAATEVPAVCRRIPQHCAVPADIGCSADWHDEPSPTAEDRPRDESGSIGVLRCVSTAVNIE